MKEESPLERYGTGKELKRFDFITLSASAYLWAVVEEDPPALWMTDAEKPEPAMAAWDR